MTARPPGDTPASNTLPNPGSREALNAGCICAVLDNCHGRFPPLPAGGWYVTVGCPIHSPSPGGDIADGVCPGCNGMRAPGQKWCQQCIDEANAEATGE